MKKSSFNQIFVPMTSAPATPWEESLGESLRDLAEQLQAEELRQLVGKNKKRATVDSEDPQVTMVVSIRKWLHDLDDLGYLHFKKPPDKYGWATSSEISMVIILIQSNQVVKKYKTIAVTAGSAWGYNRLH